MPARTPGKAARRPRLLSGGNPQIAKAYGTAPVKAYLAAIPGWKRDVARRVDRLITRTVPGVKKAVKWNSPLYGLEIGRWFLSLHCFTNYLRITFFRGAALQPSPPRSSKMPNVRYHDIREDDPIDDARLADWIRQASKLPGEKL
jgi:hypothetical protein